MNWEKIKLGYNTKKKKEVLIAFGLYGGLIFIYIVAAIFAGIILNNQAFFLFWVVVFSASICIVSRIIERKMKKKERKFKEKAKRMINSNEFYQNLLNERNISLTDDQKEEMKRIVEGL